MHSESKFARLSSFNHRDTYEHIKQMVLSKGHKVLVAFKDGELIGFMAAYMSYFFFNNQYPQCMENGWYVKKEYRRGATGLIMLKKLMAWAKKKGAHSFLLCDSVLIENKQIEKIMDKFGFDTDYIAYRKVL